MKSQPPRPGDSSASVPDEAPDALLLALRDLPRHDPTSASSRRVHARARAAFVRAAGAAPSHAAAIVTGGGAAVLVGRAVVPVVLAAVVALYLLWAFAVAISLNQ